MFGNNPIRKQDLSQPESLWVQEVFPTIQGEGPFAGRPAIFVRFGGCNLKCWWCDTDFESSKWRATTDELVEAVLRADEQIISDLVVLTGGEPLRQDITPFVAKLCDLGYRVQIETNGILWVPNMLPYLISGTGDVTFVVSPKTGKINEIFAEYPDRVFYKYIVSRDDANDIDGLPMYSTQVKDRPNLLARPPKGTNKRERVFVQPLDVHEPEANKRNEKFAAELCMKHGYRLSFQLHKHLGLP